MKKILIFAIAIILLAGGGFAGYSYWQKAKEDKFLSSDPQTKDAYELIKKRREEVKKDPMFYDGWMSMGFNWKGIGEVTREDKYLWRAVKMYNEVIKRWGNKAYLPFLNRANVYILLKEYEKAEDDLKVSLEIDPGEQNLYISLAELYKYYLNKEPKEIKAVYERGIKTVVGGGNLVNSYASYLNEIGEYEFALRLYKILSQAYPDNTGYKELIKELEAKVNGGSAT